MIIEKERPSASINVQEIFGFFKLAFEILIIQIRLWLTCIQSFVRAVLPKTEISVNGENVLITGTGHGIGRELALHYSSLGAKVICWDINKKNNDDTVQEIKSLGGQAYSYTCNVMNRSDINELAQKIKNEHGFIKIIVNNAGIMPCHPLLQTTESEVRNMFEINVLAHFWIIHAFLPDMIARTEGNIVALSSVAGLYGLPNLVPYCGTKFAVRGLMEALNEELRRLNPQNNIKTTTIYPYMVDTGLCKKPRYRFPKLMKLVNAKDAAKAIIHAQRTGLEEASIPRHFLYINKATTILPKDALRILDNFLDAGVESDL